MLYIFPRAFGVDGHGNIRGLLCMLSIISEALLSFLGFSREGVYLGVFCDWLLWGVCADLWCVSGADLPVCGSCSFCDWSNWCWDSSLPYLVMWVPVCIVVDHISHLLFLFCVVSGLVVKIPLIVLLYFRLWIL